MISYRSVTPLVLNVKPIEVRLTALAILGLRIPRIARLLTNRKAQHPCGQIRLANCSSLPKISIKVTDFSEEYLAPEIEETLRPEFLLAHSWEPFRKIERSRLGDVAATKLEITHGQEVGPQAPRTVLRENHRLRSKLTLCSPAQRILRATNSKKLCVLRK
ncbi:MAG: hypothetical protein MI861_17045, partial [Pirellulales bacterium]|nr:hypothetical protein [Pirellulales bacterium]